MGLLSAAVDLLLNRPIAASKGPPSPAAAALHASSPVVDLLVGSALFRSTFVTAAGRGHVDLPRLRAGGVNVVGLTVATRFPDLRGTLSNWHFRSLGMPAARLRSNVLIADWLIARIHAWADESGGQLVVLRTPADLEQCLAPGGPVGVLISVQGGHALDGDLRNVARLHALGVRMLAPAHVMDNHFVGSATGRRAYGLTGFGREAVAALESSGVIVDLAHMSLPGIAETLPLLERPFTLSHTGLVEVHGRGSRWRRYTPARRNIPAAVATEVGRAGGLVGAVLGVPLLGGGLDKAVELVQRLVESAGERNVGIGSDMDGALRAPIDAAGLPRLTDALLAAGMPRDVVQGVMGSNAVELLRRALAA